MVNRSSIKQQITKPPSKNKIKKVLGEFKRGTLTSGKSKNKVKNRKQAIAIALSEARRKQRRS